MELRLLAQQRVDDRDVLTLDDGSLVVLQEGDTIRAKKVKSCSPPQYCDPTPTGAVFFRFRRFRPAEHPASSRFTGTASVHARCFSRSRGTSRRSGNALSRFSDIDCGT